MSTQDFNKNAKEMFENVDRLLLEETRSDNRDGEQIKDLTLARQILLNELLDGEVRKQAEEFYRDVDNRANELNADPFAQPLNAYEAPTWGQENK